MKCCFSAGAACTYHNYRHEKTSVILLSIGELYNSRSNPFFDEFFCEL